MSKAGKLVKSLFKTKKESVMGKLGDSPFDDPMEPWSAKYNSPVKNEGAFSSGQLKPSKELLDKIKKIPSQGTIVDRDSKGVYTAKTVNGKEVSREYKKEEFELDEAKSLADLAADMAASARKVGIKGAHVTSTAQVHRQSRKIMKKRAEKEKANPTPYRPRPPEPGPDYRLGSYDPVTHRSYSEEVEQLDEDSWLFSYIKSLGYNPKIMNFAQRSKYARSNAFKHYKQSHMERSKFQPEEVEHLDEAGTGLLMTYIKAKGLNPLTMDGNQKHAYARSSEFKIFKQKHHKVKKEEFDRLVKTYGAENLAELVMSIQETSGMGERGDDWNEETGLKVKKKKIKEEADKADTVTMDIPLLIRVLEYAREDAKTDMDLHKVVENLIKMRDEGTLSMAQYDAIVKIKEDIERIQELKKMPDNMDSDDHITREEKTMKGKDPCWKGYQMVGTKKKGGRTVPNCVPEQVQEGIGGIEDSPLSATNSVKAMESAHRNKQMKSARMIKSLYKNKLKKENLYDWEKDDKPNAKIIMKGGTTMTGQPRDTVEIEPVLKTRPNSAKPSN